MKTLYMAYGFWGTFFVDESGGLVSYIHENDGDFRMEYMSWIPEYFGGKIVCLGEMDHDGSYPWDHKDEIKKWAIGKMKTIKTAKRKKKTTKKKVAKR